MPCVLDLKYYAFLVYFWGLFQVVFAQELSFRQITTEQGLPSNEVYSIIQDKDGFIWIGCDAGLFKYDGISFISYKTSKQKSKSVAALTQTPNGRIYCHNFTGQVFYVENDQMFVIEDIGDTYISNIMASPDNDLYMTSSEGLIAYSPVSNQSRHIPEINFLTSRGMVDKQGNVWFTGDKSGKLEKEKRKTLFLETNEPLAGFHAYFQYNQAIYLINTISGELFQVSQHTLEEIKVPSLQAALIGKKITNIFVKDTKIWITTYSGLISYDFNRKEAQVFLENFSLSSFYEDKEGGLWVSTLYDGILYIPETSFLYWKETEKALKITHDGKNIYFGDTKGNIHTISPISAIHRVFNIGYKADIRSLNYSPFDKLIYFNANNNLYRLKNEKTELVFEETGAVKDFLLTHQYAFVATSSGTYPLAKKSEKVLSSKSFINNQWGRYLLYDSLANVLWIASNKGLYKSVETGNQWVVEEIFFQDKQILGLAALPDFKKLFAVSFEGILFELNGAESPKVLAELPESVQVYQMLYYQNRLILATNKGIWIWHLIEQSWQQINKIDGLISNEILSLCILQNKIWVASPKGVQYLPINYQFSKNLAKIFLKKVLINDEVEENLKSLHLQQKDNLRLKLATVCYYSAEKFQYAYRINKNTRWTYLPASSEYISINNLPAGDFFLEIKVIDHKNRDSQNSIVLEGYIYPSIWQRTWFVVGCILIFLLILTLFFKRRLRFIQIKQDSELKRIALENELKLWQQTALQVQMNPHFLFNILNSIKTYIYENDKKNAVLYLNQFADLVRKILHHSNHKSISLAEEIEMLRLYINLEAMLLGEDFSWEIQIDKNIGTEDIFVPTLLIQPFVENAFKHGLRHKKGEKQLAIRIRLIQKNQLCIEIEDNGIGRKLSAEINQKNKNLHQSFATQNIQKRIELLNQNKEYQLSTQTEDLYTQTGEGIGTRVHIHFVIDDFATK